MNKQNNKRFKQTEQKINLIEMLDKIMVYKQKEGLAKLTIQGFYEYFHYLNDFLGGNVPNDEVTVDFFRIKKAITEMFVSEPIEPFFVIAIKKVGSKLDKGILIPPPI